METKSIGVNSGAGTACHFRAHEFTPGKFGAISIKYVIIYSRNSDRMVLSKKKPVDIKLSVRFWNNLHQIRSKSIDWKAK
jgi:hypothetical protein